LTNVIKYSGAFQTVPSGMLLGCFCTKWDATNAVGCLRWTRGFVLVKSVNSVPECARSIKSQCRPCEVSNKPSVLLPVRPFEQETMPANQHASGARV